MARIGITAMPERGVDISLMPISGGRCIVRLFKDEQSTEANGMAQITADVVELEMVYYDDLQLEVESNFEKYFEIGAQKELAEAKTKKLAVIKTELAESDYKCFKHADGAISDTEYENTRLERETLRAKFNAIQSCTTLAEVEVIDDAV